MPFPRTSPSTARRTFRRRGPGEPGDECGDLDVAFRPAGGSGYEELAASAVGYDLDGRVVLVASLDDVIHAKESADRPKDRAVLPILRALRDELA